MWYCYLVIGVLSTLVLFYWIVEFHYFLRMAVTAFHARFLKSRVHILHTTTVTGVCLITDVDTLLYHMNNARYIRELDFARVDFYQRTRLYQRIMKKGGGVVQGACTIRYRRFIPTFTVYTITSRVIYWDSSSIYMEHRFITPKDGFVRAIAVCKQRVLGVNTEEMMDELLLEADEYRQEKEIGIEEVEEVVVSEPRIDEGQENGLANTKEPADNGNAVRLEADLTPGGKVMTTTAKKKVVRRSKKPEIPLEVLRWDESNQISSANLRNGC